MLIVKILAVLFVVGYLYNLFLTGRKLNKDAERNAKQAKDARKVPPEVIELYDKAYNYETGYDEDSHQDLDRAVEFYTYAANRDYPPAQYKLAQLYFSGKTIGSYTLEKDYDKALKYAKQALEHDYPGAKELVDNITTMKDLKAKHAELHETK